MENKMGKEKYGSIDLINICETKYAKEIIIICLNSILYINGRKKTVVLTTQIKFASQKLQWRTL